MIFLSILSLVFGFTLVALGLIFQDKLGPIPAGLIVAVIAFIGSSRFAHNRKSRAELGVSALATLAPVWLVPLLAGSSWQIERFAPAMGIVSLSAIAGLVLTVWRERGRVR
ncbi:hypothetical protein HZB60_10865 [candidate division KSB1 bacterium]|nr:hypothetical protein [candidate division KSB1 bacterium]